MDGSLFIGGNILSLIKKKNKDIRIIPLGGVGEIAKICTSLK